MKLRLRPTSRFEAVKNRIANVPWVVGGRNNLFYISDFIIL
jgi:hypothetical protein